MIKSIKLLLLVFLFAILLSGCNDQKSDANASINENVNTAKLAQILKQPSNYVDKEIVVNGNYFTACAASCCANEFILKDGINQIKVLGSKDLNLSEIKVAQPIRLSGILKSTAETPYLQANAIEVRK